MSQLGTDSISSQPGREEFASRFSLLSALLAQSSDGIAVIDAQGRVVAFSESYGRTLQTIWGLALQVGDSLAAALAPLPPAAADEYLDAWRRALAGERTTRVMEWGQPGGEPLRWEIEFSPLDTPQGERLGAFHIARDITPRATPAPSHAALEAKLADLRRSEAEYRALFDLAAVGKCEVDPISQRMVRVNRKLCEMLGYTAEELLQRSPLEMTHPDDRATTLALMERAAEGPAFELHYDKRYLHRDGHVVWGAVTSASLHDVNGQARRIILVIQDVTERRRAEQAEYEWAARLRAIVETAVDGIVTFDEFGAIETVNPAAERIFGYTAAEMLGHHLGLLIPESLHADALAADLHATGRGREVRGRRKGGAEFPVELAVSEMRLENRPLFTGIVRDVSDRTRAHAALRLANQQTERSLAQLQAVIGNMTEGVVVADAHGTLLDMNPAALAMHRVAQVESIRRPLAELAQYFKLYDLDGRELSQPEWPLSRALRGETFAALEMRVVQSRSRYEWIASYGGTVVRDKAGGIQLAILTVRDVTPQKAVEEELRQLNENLELRVTARTALLKKRNEQLRVLAAKLTAAEHQERRRIAQLLHDHFQQLLVAAKIGVDQIRKSALDARLQGVVRNVNEIIDQSIQASRTLAVELCPPILYDRGLAAALEWLSRQFHEQHGLRVEVQIEAAAEPANADVQAFLLQAVRELLLNVVKHAQAPAARVTMSAAENGQVRLTVEDAGPGFESQATLAPADGEHGFGLFSIQQRVGLLGGRFELHTAPGEGCRVTLLAPCEPLGDESVPPAAGAPLDEQPAGAPGRRGGQAERMIRLLLVDDHKIMRQGLARLLSSEGDIELVGEAGDGQEALDLVRQLQPEVVVMDVSMPRMDGIRATRSILQSHPETRIIGLSMHERDDMAQAMLEAGAAVYLTKGGPSEKLVAAIRGL